MKPRMNSGKVLEIEGLVFESIFAGEENAIFKVKRHSNSLQRVRIVGVLGIQRMNSKLCFIFGSLINEVLENHKLLSVIHSEIIEQYFHLNDYDFESELTEHINPKGLMQRRDVM